MITLLLVGLCIAVIAGFCFAIALCALGRNADDRMERLIEDFVDDLQRRVPDRDRAA